MRKNQKGFSLIELLIVVAIILIIAAIASPNLLRSRMSANEASAVGSVRLLVTCSIGYQTGHPDVGYPTTTKELAPVAYGGIDGCIDEVLTDASDGTLTPKSGYVFDYTVVVAPSGLNTQFAIDGHPLAIDCGRTGQRTYFTDDSGVVRFLNAPGCPQATVLSPPI